MMMMVFRSRNDLGDRRRYSHRMWHIDGAIFDATD